MNWKIAVGGLAAFSVLFVGLFIKNKRAEQTYRELSKENLIIISKKIRKQRYIVYKQIALFAANIMQQMRNSINTTLIEQYINGPQSPLKVKQLFEEITEKICQQYEITSEEYSTNLEKHKSDFELQAIVKLHQSDYMDSLRGKLPHFQVVVPPSLTKQTFIQIQNKITKLAYCQQVKIFRKLKQFSEVELQQNPGLLQDLGNPEEQQQNILKEYGLQTEFQPASAIFKEAEVKFHSDLLFKAKIEQIEKSYQKLLRKYAPKLQTKAITDHQLNELQEQILRIDIKA